MIVNLSFPPSSFWSLHTAVQRAVVTQEELSCSDARQRVKTTVCTVTVPRPAYLSAARPAHGRELTAPLPGSQGGYSNGLDATKGSVRQSVAILV